MYKLWNESANGYITWQPPDNQLAADIVKEVTGKSTSMEDPVEVTEEQVTQIHKLYEERNHDPVDMPPVTPDEGKLLGKQIAELKIDAMKKDQVNKQLGKKIGELTIYGMEKDRINKQLGKQVGELTVKIMKLEGGKE